MEHICKSAWRFSRFAATFMAIFLGGFGQGLEVIRRCMEETNVRCGAPKLNVWCFHTASNRYHIWTLSLLCVLHCSCPGIVDEDPWMSFGKSCSMRHRDNLASIVESQNVRRMGHATLPCNQTSSRNGIAPRNATLGQHIRGSANGRTCCSTSTTRSQQLVRRKWGTSPHQERKRSQVWVKQ